MSTTHLANSTAFLLWGALVLALTAIFLAVCFCSIGWARKKPHIPSKIASPAKKEKKKRWLKGKISSNYQFEHAIEPSEEMVSQGSGGTAKSDSRTRISIVQEESVGQVTPVQNNVVQQEIKEIKCNREIEDCKTPSATEVKIGFKTKSEIPQEKVPRFSSNQVLDNSSAKEKLGFMYDLDEFPSPPVTRKASNQSGSNSYQNYIVNLVINEPEIGMVRQEDDHGTGQHYKNENIERGHHLTDEELFSRALKAATISDFTQLKYASRRRRMEIERDQFHEHNPHHHKDTESLSTASSGLEVFPSDTSPSLETKSVSGLSTEPTTIDTRRESHLAFETVEPKIHRSVKLTKQVRIREALRRIAKPKDLLKVEVLRASPKKFDSPKTMHFTDSEGSVISSSSSESSLGEPEEPENSATGKETIENVPTERPGSWNSKNLEPNSSSIGQNENSGGVNSWPHGEYRLATSKSFKDITEYHSHLKTPKTNNH